MWLVLTKFLRKLYAPLATRSLPVCQSTSMRNFLPIRILTVVFALTMMAGYVVHSRQQTRVTAPGSKFGVLRVPGDSTSLPLVPTNQPAAALDPVFASSSKSMAPLLKVPAPNQPQQQSQTSAPALGAPIPATNALRKATTNRTAQPRPAS